VWRTSYPTLAYLLIHLGTDLDPNQDTPVEVLHVVLLGFVKYFWRDVVSRLSADEKRLLIQRLDSLDVRALGISPLRGESLVKYAGSLTGRDFRAIIQVAPAVLYGLRGLPAEAYKAWLSLARLVPLVYQSEIDNLDIYLVRSTSCMHTLFLTDIKHRAGSSHRRNQRFSGVNRALDHGVVQQEQVPHDSTPTRSCAPFWTGYPLRNQRV
jgi:hypothetical protein